MDFGVNFLRAGSWGIGGKVRSDSSLGSEATESTRRAVDELGGCGCCGAVAGAERLGGGNVARTEPPNGAQVPTPLGLQPSDVAASEAMFSAKRKSRFVSNKLSGAERPGPL